MKFWVSALLVFVTSATVSAIVTSYMLSLHAEYWEVVEEFKRVTLYPPRSRMHDA